MASDVRKFCLPPRASILDAMKIIDECSGQIALVVDDNYCLLGTLTDGDIRRGLLHGADLNSRVDSLMNCSFRSVLFNEDQSNIIEMMRRDSLRQMPVLDDDGRIVQLLSLQELISPSSLSNPVVIMAGGKGKRLRPYTEFCPKPMLPVGDKPILETLLEQCVASGFHNFYFSVNYLKDQIIDYFEDGSRWGVSINYLIEDQPLGTAGSLHLLPDSLTEPLLVFNGDVLTRLEPRRLLNFHIDHDASATLCVREHLVTIPFGIVEMNGVEFSGIIEKPTYRHQVNAGVYVIDPQLLPLLSPQQSIDMPSFLELAYLAGNRVAVCPIHEYWLDVGRPETLEQAHATWVGK